MISLAGVAQPWCRIVFLRPICFLLHPPDQARVSTACRRGEVANRRESVIGDFVLALTFIKDGILTSNAGDVAAASASDDGKRDCGLYGNVRLRAENINVAGGEAGTGGFKSRSPRWSHRN